MIFLKLLFKFLIFIIFIALLLFIKNKYYQKIKRNYNYYKRKIDSKYSLFKRKHYIILSYLKKIITSFFIFVSLTLVLFVFLYFNNILVIKNKNILFNVEVINIKKTAYEFLWSQISSTLIVSSIISLLSIFDTTYIYGEKQINVIFNSKSIFSLGKLFSFLVFLTLISLNVCLSESHYYLLFFSFVISLMIIFYMIFKVIFFYTHPQYFREKIETEYILGERKHIKNALPLNPHKDLHINDFKEHTISLIKKNDYDYVTNINEFFNMLEISLLINQKEIQRYYTEMVLRTDFISSILEIIKNLIENNREIEACGYMSQLYGRIKYYQIILVQDIFSYGIIESLIIKGKYIQDEDKCISYYNNLWNIINSCIYFVYFYNCEVDLSNTRLGKLGYIYYIAHNRYLEEMYLSIKENKLLSNKERLKLFEKLYDNITMIEFKEEFPDLNVNQLLAGEIINENKISIPLIIKGEPIILLFLKMFEEKDFNNIAIFKTMNVSDILIDFITIVTTLSILEYIYKDGNRRYVNELEIDVQTLIDIFKKSNFHNIRNTNNLNNIYEIIDSNYIEKKQSQKRYYVLLPRLFLTDDVVSNYFYHICNQRKVKMNYINLRKNTNNKKIQEIINSLNIK